MALPVIQIFEYDINEVATPIGARHIPGGSFAFKQQVALGCNIATNSSESGTLIFDGIKFDLDNGVPNQDPIISTTTPLTISIANSGYAITDVRFYLSDNSAISQPAMDRGLPEPILQASYSGVWLPGLTIASGAGTAITTTIPEQQNIFRQDGSKVLGASNDENASQFIYLNLVIPWGYPFLNYGICGSGLMRFNISYSYYANSFTIVF